MGEKIKILCYGDYNTWGYIPGTDHQRFSKDERWPGALQRMLGDKYEIIEEVITTNDIYHEIGYIYCTTIENIKRIDYQEIKE